MKTIPEVLFCSFFIFLFLVVWNLSRRSPQMPVVSNPAIYWDYDRPTDAAVYLDFRTRILPEDLCNPVTLLVIVHSKPSNLKVRNSVRQSWGRKPHHDSLVFFLLGDTSDASLQEEIFKESAEFEDIIQEDFVDTYANLTIKSITMLKLALHCDHSFKYLLKTDDDTLLNLDSIVRMLSIDGSQDLLMGHLFCDAAPDRNPQSKWYTPYWRYWYDTYPLYLSGGGYLMSWEVAQKIFLKLWERKPHHDPLVLFLLGNTSDASLQEEVFKESAEFEDIIQKDFVDTYANLTIKSITMLKPALHCDHSFKYLLKTDDDTLLNLDSIVRMLSRDGSQDLLMGHLFCNAAPDRNPQSKWYTPYWRYWYDTYPWYLSGGGYLMSWEVAQKIFLKVWTTPLFHMEDVYLTGICANKAGVKPKHSSLFVKKGAVYTRKECFLKKAHMVFDVAIEEMLEWNMIMKDKQWEKKCSGFSSLNWVFGSVFKSWDNFFSYRRTCK